MLQKIAAIVSFAAANLLLMGAQVRWLLHNYYFSIVATSAADLLLEDNINIRKAIVRGICRDKNLRRRSKKNK